MRRIVTQHQKTALGQANCAKACMYFFRTYARHVSANSSGVKSQHLCHCDVLWYPDSTDHLLVDSTSRALVLLVQTCAEVGCSCNAGLCYTADLEGFCGELGRSRSPSIPASTINVRVFGVALITNRCGNRFAQGAALDVTILPVVLKVMVTR